MKPKTAPKPPSRRTTRALRVGDTIGVWWTPNRDTITALRPYTGPLLPILGKGTKLADFALNKCGMTLVAGDVYDVYNR